MADEIRRQTDAFNAAWRAVRHTVGALDSPEAGQLRQTLSIVVPIILAVADAEHRKVAEEAMATPQDAAR